MRLQYGHKVQTGTGRIYFWNCIVHDRQGADAQLVRDRRIPARTKLPMGGGVCTREAASEALHPRDVFAPRKSYGASTREISYVLVQVHVQDEWHFGLIVIDHLQSTTSVQQLSVQDVQHRYPAHPRLCEDRAAGPFSWCGSARLPSMPPDLPSGASAGSCYIFGSSTRVIRGSPLARSTTGELCTSTRGVLHNCACPSSFPAIRPREVSFVWFRIDRTGLGRTTYSNETHHRQAAGTSLSQSPRLVKEEEDHCRRGDIPHIGRHHRRSGRRDRGPEDSCLHLPQLDRLIWPRAPWEPVYM